MPIDNRPLSEVFNELKALRRRVAELEARERPLELQRVMVRIFMDQKVALLAGEADSNEPEYATYMSPQECRRLELELGRARKVIARGKPKDR